MGRFVQRVVITVAADLLGYAIAEAIIERVKKKKDTVIVDTVTY